MRSVILGMPGPRALAPLARADVLGGALLLLAAAAAMVWANAPWAGSYVALWSYPVTVGQGAFALSKPLVVWVNEALMAFFFLLVGLEIKREVLRGELASVRKATLPLAAAVGGMVVPALIYAALNRGAPGAAGWGVPMATDIAFALGLLAILGRGAPVALKVLLAAVAIVDDLGAIVVIAVAYTSGVSTTGLLWAGVALALLVLANRSGARSVVPFAVLGAALWYALLGSGVHATLAGVLVAATIPLGDAGRDGSDGLLHGLERGLRPWVAFGIVPVFALANAGVPLDLAAVARLGEPVGLGVVLGLVAGKQIGVLSFSWAAMRLGIARLPAGVTWRHLHGVAALCGVGFTMALFIGHLAFTDATLLEQSKTAILFGSLISALWARVLLRPAGEAPVATATPSLAGEADRDRADDGRLDEAA